MRRTKIIATIGPTSGSEKMMSDLAEMGVDCFRFNLKHNSQKWHQEKISLSRKIAKRTGKRVMVMIDIVRSDYPIEVDDYDLVALSYLKNEREIDNLRQRLKTKGKNVPIIAKIENRMALGRLEKIISRTEAIMVARGDLGEDLPIEELGFFQKKIIDNCRKSHCPVIVATQMLLSMTENPKPTRAEASDVSNAIFDGTDGVMLSDETAIGKYPTETVKIMDKIARYCEESGEIRKVEIEAKDLGQSLVAGAIEIVKKAKEGQIGGMVVFTKTGATARVVSSYRTKLPIVAVSDSRFGLDQADLGYGIIPYYQTFGDNKFEQNNKIFGELRRKGLLGNGSEILVIHGNNWFEPGSAHNLSLVKRC